MDLDSCITRFFAVIGRRLKGDVFADLTWGGGCWKIGFVVHEFKMGEAESLAKRW